MTLGYAILGLLSREVLGGYELTQRMKGRVGHFWSARHSEIYPELVWLGGGGYIHSVVEQKERPDKKVYEITAEGSMKALKEWITQPPTSTQDELVPEAYSI